MYCGCETSANRTRWTVFAVLLVIAIALAIARGVVWKNLEDSFDDCYESRGCFKSGDTWNCSNIVAVVEYCVDENSRGLTALLVLLVFGILFLIGCSIPLCVMCCCTKKPSQSPQVYVRMATPYNNPQVHVAQMPTPYNNPPDTYQAKV
eukprot:TRINITY_DN198_c0_g1_i9.p6 TRINITY_DN198_c0_g1~~TRINITY_DN198_c0_g1_i9.p6  ORF type:complete len:149 (-),score=15.62 TRINITY_DN198_c0_g1_i9:1377-1823(-)